MHNKSKTESNSNLLITLWPNFNLSRLEEVHKSTKEEEKKNIDPWKWIERKDGGKSYHGRQHKSQDML